jgi:hypothetical protein
VRVNVRKAVVCWVLTAVLGASAPAASAPNAYRHLGANSAGRWGGVAGRISVVNGSVRAGSYDFVAARFMAKRDLGGGRIAWLEAGWAETGWTAPGRQRVYTYDSNNRTWQFYDQFPLLPGDRIWIDLHAEADGSWVAWLWWGNRWNLLTTQRLPIGPTAHIEQYVEVHADPARPTRVTVPTVTVDNVELRATARGRARRWRADVPTLTGPGGGGLCLTWVVRYDTWTAGDCGPTSRPRSRTSGSR